MQDETSLATQERVRCSQCRRVEISGRHGRGCYRIDTRAPGGICLGVLRKIGRPTLGTPWAHVTGRVGDFQTFTPPASDRRVG